MDNLFSDMADFGHIDTDADCSDVEDMNFQCIGSQSLLG